MKKKLTIGAGSFLNMIQENWYYVDKTAYIKPQMESGSCVHLITRPRRFGKTLFMDTLRTFLEVDARNPGDVSRQASIFADLKIRKEEAFCRRFMGQHPVLYLTLKQVKGLTFDAAMASLADTLQPIAADWVWIADSPRLQEDDRRFLKKCSLRDNLLNPANRADLLVFLEKMAMILGRYFERQVILLIDAYDVPLQKASKGDYYPEMLTFMQGFLSCLKPGSTLKLADGRHAVRKAVLAGISKTSIFTDVNNLDVSSVFSQGGPLSSAFGFTPGEVTELLNDYDLEANSAVVKDWYGGYRIGNAEVYCPRDVIRFCNAFQSRSENPEAFIPSNYWADTSSNEVIDEFLGLFSPEDADRLQTLCGDADHAPGEVVINVNRQLACDAFKHPNSADFWTLLLFTGYLTVVAQLDVSTFRVRIPNCEVLETFKQRIKAKFSPNNRAFVLSGKDVVTALFEGDAAAVKEKLLRLLKEYVFVRDSATRSPAENYYQGFMTDLLISLKNHDIAHFASYAEAGDGYADILFTSADENIGVVMELKSCQPREKIRSAQNALARIREKHSVEGLSDFRCSHYWGVGIAFSGRTCAVAIEALDPALRRSAAPRKMEVGKHSDALVASKNHLKAGYEAMATDKERESEAREWMQIGGETWEHETW